MSLDIVKEIAQSEKELETTVEKSQKKAAKLVQDAEAKVAASIAAKKKELEEAHFEAVEQHKKDLAAKQEAALEAADAEAAALVQKAEGSIDKAAEYVYQEFLKSLK